MSQTAEMLPSKRLTSPINGRKKARKYKHPSAYLMLFPSYFIYFIFSFIPVIITIYFSFTNYDLYKRMDFVGFQNYIHLWSDESFKIAARNTIVYSIFTIVPQMALGLWVAVMVNKRVFAQKLHRMAIYLPNVTSMVAMSMVWLWLYDPSIGLVNQGMKAIGLAPQKWLYDTDLALPSIIVMSLWKLVGFNMIIYLAGLQQIPSDLYEAAKLDGASSFRQFCSITFPLLTPTSFFLLVMGTVSSFSVFEQVNIMTQGGPINATTTIVHQIYERAFSFFQMGYASAMAVILIIVTLLLTLLNFKMSKQHY
jgi:ABC-type sugar transport system permease subunit